MVHLVVIICVAVTLYSVILFRWQGALNQSKHVVSGLSILLILQFTVLFVDLASTSGYLKDNFFVLITNIAVICLSIIWLTWTWCSVRVTKSINYVVIGISTLSLAFFVYTAITTINPAAESQYDKNQFTMNWVLAGTILYLTGIVIIAIYKPANWGVAILLLTLLSAGMIGQYFFSLSGSFLPLPLRIASLFAFPLLPGVIKALHPKHQSNKTGIVSNEQIDSQQPPVNFELINRTAQDYETLVNQLQSHVETLLLKINHDDDITKLASLEALLSETSQLLQDTTSLNYLVSQWYDWSGSSGKYSQNQNEIEPAAWKIYQSIFALKGYFNTLSEPNFPMAEISRTRVFEESYYFIGEINASSQQILSALNFQHSENRAKLQQTNLHQVLAAAVASVEKIIQQKNIALSLNIPDRLPDIGISSKFLIFQLARLLSAVLKIMDNDSVIYLSVATGGEANQLVHFSIIASNLKPPLPQNTDQLSQDIQQKLTTDQIEFYSQIETIKIVIAPVSGQLEFNLTENDSINILLKFPID